MKKFILLVLTVYTFSVQSMDKPIVPYNQSIEERIARLEKNNCILQEENRRLKVDLSKISQTNTQIVNFITLKQDDEDKRKAEKNAKRQEYVKEQLQKARMTWYQKMFRQIPKALNAGLFGGGSHAGAIAAGALARTAPAIIPLGSVASPIVYAGVQAAGGAAGAAGAQFVVDRAPSIILSIAKKYCDARFTMDSFITRHRYGSILDPKAWAAQSLDLNVVKAAFTVLDASFLIPVTTIGVTRKIQKNLSCNNKN